LSDECVLCWIRHTSRRRSEVGSFAIAREQGRSGMAEGHVTGGRTLLKNATADSRGRHTNSRLILSYDGRTIRLSSARVLPFL
jgi:hypothetical protein